MGNRGTGRLLRSRLPAAPTLDAPGDPLEREADRVAAEIVRRPQPTRVAGRSAEPHVQRACPECKRAAREQRASSAEGCSACACQASQTAGPVGDGQRSSGRPLPDPVRAFFEPRFGRAFGAVRVHTDAAAAHAARDLQAQAFTLGSYIHFGADQYSPSTETGRRLLAHELVHVVQQTPRAPADRPELWTDREAAGRPLIRGRARGVQRRVIDRHVSCRTTGLHGGVPGGVLSGADAISTIRAADARAIDLARRAENMLFLQRLTFGTGAYTADPVFDAALANRFGLALATPADHRVIAILEREFRAVADFLQSGSIFYVCRDADCDAGDWAFVFSGERTIRLCNPFWNSGNVDHQGATLMHEAMHLWWDQIEDRGHRPLHNAHCFEQFALDLAGVAVMPGFAGACVV